MHCIALILLSLCIVLCVYAGEQENAAIALEKTLHQVFRSDELWPGYDPLSVPLAVFDGSNTFLFRHPAPPEDFSAKRSYWIFAGLHPRITANSSTSIGGIATATVMLESLPVDRSPQEYAALVAHEDFHVFQGTTGRLWGANEVDLFTYPVDNAELLALRCLETEALRCAFATQKPEEIKGWAICALNLRKERFSKIDKASKAYERGIETMEGTATYIEYKVSRREKPYFPDNCFAAEEVRNRTYTTGVAWALLLDSFHPDWCEGFAENDSLFLDNFLAQVLADSQQTSQLCTLNTSEITAAKQAAQIDVKNALEQRIEKRLQFESTPGWRVIVEANDANPL